MTKSEIKSEIQKVLDKVPEEILQDILDFLRELEEQPIENVRLAKNLRLILAEDNELLGRLAK